MQKKEELFFVVPEFGTKGQRGRNSEYICTGYESFEGTHTTSQKENLHIYNPCWKLSVLAQRGEEMRPVWYSSNPPSSTDISALLHFHSFL